MTSAVTKTVGGRYRLSERLAAGGMGEVWRAEDTVLGRAVAIKLLRAEYADDFEFRARLRWEGRHAAGLSHPGLAQVYDYGDGGEDESPYLVMEFVGGEPLSAVLAEEGTLSTGRVLDIVCQVATGLAGAHRAGLVHRDIKPSNLLIDAYGTVKITDFGIAWAADATPLTRTGEIIGTPLYLSPEQAAGGRATPASDLYSLGVIAYQCLTGRTPFEGHPIAVVIAHRDEPIPPLPATVPAPVRDLVAALTAKKAADRPSDAERVARWANRLLARLPPATGKPVVRPRPADDRFHRSGGGHHAATLRTRMAPWPWRGRVWLGVAAVAIALAGGGTGWLLHHPLTGRQVTATRAGSVSGPVAPAPVLVDPSRYYGRPLADAVAGLRGLGLRTAIRERAVPNLPPFTVVQVSPAGEVPPRSTVTIYYAAQLPAGRPGPSNGGPGDEEDAGDKSQKPDKGRGGHRGKG